MSVHEVDEFHNRVVSKLFDVFIGVVMCATIVVVIMITALGVITLGAEIAKRIIG